MSALNDVTGMDLKHQHPLRLRFFGSGPPGFLGRGIVVLRLGTKARPLDAYWVMLDGGDYEREDEAEKEEGREGGGEGREEEEKKKNDLSQLLFTYSSLISLSRMQDRRQDGGRWFRILHPLEMV